MKPSLFSSFHPEKIQVEFYPIFFRVAKAPIFSKLKTGCRLKGQICIKGQVPLVKNIDLIVNPIFVKKMARGFGF